MPAVSQASPMGFRQCCSGCYPGEQRGAQSTDAFSGAAYTCFCAILTARTLPIVRVCAIKVELGLFVFTLNIFFDGTGFYLYYLYQVFSL